MSQKRSVLPKEENGSDSRHFAFAGQSASDQARQHVGNVFNNTSYVYTIRKRRSDETLRPDERDQVLLKAAKEGQFARLKYLIHRLGVNIDYVDDDGFTALHHGVLSGFEDVVEVLLEAGIDVNACSTKFGTPLHLAALKGRANIVELLLKYRADVNVDTASLGSPLHCASYSGDTNIASAILRQGGVVNNVAMVDAIRLQGPSLKTPNSKFESGKVIVWYCDALFIAVKFGQTEMVVELIKNGAETNYPSDEWSFDPNGANQRLDNTDPQPLTPLSTAVMSGNVDLCLLLLDNGAPVDGIREKRPIVIAAKAGYLRCLDILIRRGADVDLVDDDHLPALYYAVVEGHTECVRSLIDCGANLDPSLPFGETLLHIAAAGGRFDIVRLLLSEGANPDARDEEYDKTPLDYAVNRSALRNLTDLGKHDHYHKTISMLEEVTPKRELSPKAAAAPVRTSVNRDDESSSIEKNSGSEDDSFLKEPIPPSEGPSSRSFPRTMQDEPIQGRINATRETAEAQSSGKPHDSSEWSQIRGASPHSATVMRDAVANADDAKQAGPPLEPRRHRELFNQEVRIKARPYKIEVELLRVFELLNIEYANANPMYLRNWESAYKCRRRNSPHRTYTLRVSVEVYYKLSTPIRFFKAPECLVKFEPLRPMALQEYTKLVEDIKNNLSI